MDKEKDVVISVPVDPNEIDKVIFNGIPHQVRGRGVSKIELVIISNSIPKLNFEYEARTIGEK